MFDIVHVHQLPTSFTPVSNGSKGFRLLESLKVTIGTGFPTRINHDTAWREIGRINEGAVFATRDQVITVEASNIYEAQIVVSPTRTLVGFYLPVEKSFVPVTPPLPIKATELPATP